MHFVKSFDKHPSRKNHSNFDQNDSGVFGFEIGKIMRSFIAWNLSDFLHSFKIHNAKSRKIADNNKQAGTSPSRFATQDSETTFPLLEAQKIHFLKNNFYGKLS